MRNECRSGVPGAGRARRGIVLPSALAVAIASAILGPVGPAAAAEGEYLVLVDGDPAALSREVEKAGGEVEDVFGQLDVLAVTLPATQAELLDDRAGIRVEPNPVLRAFDTVAPPSYGLDRIDQRALPLSSSYTYPSAAAGAGVDVYVMDTGVRADHEQFGGRVAAGYTAIADGLGTADCNGHGTHVAGTIAGRTTGVAPAATIVPVRVLDCGGSSATGFEYLDGIDWILSHHQAGRPAVLNLSLGGAASDAVDRATAAAVADGITVVAAAGNEATDACSTSPARLPSALTVAATTSSDSRAPYSNLGVCVDLFAPGGGSTRAIVSAWHTSATATAGLAGTSMAAPHVAGAAARYLSAAPSATPDRVGTDLLAASTVGVVTSPGAGTPNRLLYADPAGLVPQPAVLDPGQAPVITGTPAAGSVLTAEAGTWGPAPVSLTYQWLRSGVPIPRATKASYRLAPMDAGRALSVRVTGAKTGYPSSSRTSEPVIVLKRLTRTSAPAVSGTPAVGATLTADPGTWGPAPVELTIEWLRSGVPIPGATGATYTVTAEDAGRFLAVRVTAAKADHAEATRTSARRVVPPPR
ncbi:S8 family serine peptidase [Naasia sp. SYSU D00057]|uniref:S8 family serine peptidase n=1 Tax=Naasia sp. SYSU D00057 TaxID=2817380 RepID=UPI001B306F1B|nr:S8 family serine peptidase [Naasia sp. SYSU D00057]